MSDKPKWEPRTPDLIDSHLATGVEIEVPGLVYLAWRMSNAEPWVYHYLEPDEAIPFAQQMLKSARIAKRNMRARKQG